MSDYSSNYEGISVTDKYLTVSFTTGQGAAKRFRHVKVPVGDLLDCDVRDALDREIAKRLVKRWEQGQPPLRGL